MGLLALHTTTRERNLYVYCCQAGRSSYNIHKLFQAVKELSKSRIRRNWLSQTRFRNTNRRPTKPNPGASTTGGSNSDDEMYAVRKEIAILKKLHHPNIVKLIEVLEDNNQDSIYMVFEMCKNGPVFPSSGEGQPYSEEKCRALFQQIVLGVEYLHAHDIVHRDIKPDNLLLSHDNVVKIVDFGVSEMFDKGKDIVEKTAGSPAFLPPELCSNNPQSISGKAADIWSMGVTLYCLSFGKMPYTGSTLIDLYASIREKPYLSIFLATTRYR
ncbi:kinase-like domain-containing protein [Paraphysoderma sedebokerense]|nr:kinase-like domain-containing protein [Paraphysoderma sedebokerense]